MPSLDLPVFGSNRVYRFISDPSHKETLSGRVRTACLTCRRKKIKCSGERDCRTCREKGIACEGFPARKQSRRASVCSSVLETTGGGVERQRMPKPIKIETSTRSLTDALESFDTATKNDPECISELKGAVADELSPTCTSNSWLDDGNMTDEPDLSQPSSTDDDSLRSLSPTIFCSETWSLDADQTVAQRLHISAQNSFETSRSELDWTEQALSMSMALGKLSSYQQWWSGECGGKHFEKVCTPAVGPPSQQDQMSQPAIASQASRSHDIQTRRQTIALPVDLLVLTNADLGFAADHSVPFDDMASCLPSRTPECTSRTNLALENHGCSSWWDISADMTAILGRSLDRGQRCT